jgi:hypothetical protein
MGSQVFMDVQIPMLWGKRAILEDKNARLSIIDLSGEKARLEILANEPAPGVTFRMQLDGLVIVKEGVELYRFDPQEKTISNLGLGLPDVQFSDIGTRVGSNWLSNNVVVGSDVGVAISKEGIAIGAALPPDLARLTIQ